MTVFLNEHIQPVFILFTPNVQAVFTDGYETILFKKNHRQPPPWLCSVIETAAGLRRSVPQEDDHHLHDLGHHRGGCIVGGSLIIPLTKRCIFHSPEWYSHWTGSIYMGMQHGHEYAAWTWTCSIDMDMMLCDHHSIVIVTLFNAFDSTFS